MSNISGKYKVLFLALALIISSFERSDASEKNETFRKNRNSKEARRLFGRETIAATMPSTPFGSYARGCLAGARQLPANGPHWQTMRLSRNRNWAHPILLAYIERFSMDAAELDGWPGLLVGDISQPRGGPMLSGHKSHQIGLDVDIWLRPSPEKKLSFNEREFLSSISVISGHFKLNKDVWTDDHARLLKRAASYANVARIFVHPTIKKKLCTWTGHDRAWLRKIRAWYGHHHHFHVRLKCPEGESACKNQAQPPLGDGCGEELAWWLSDDAYRPKSKKEPRKPLTLNDLPSDCSVVLKSK